MCKRKFSLVTIHTHDTLPIHFPTLPPMRVHDIKRCRTLAIAILKLKNRENKINFNVSIKTSQLRTKYHLKSVLRQPSKSIFKTIIQI